jgi:SAM-dependent methyltransferase
MALVQHKSIEIRFQQQVDNAREYLIPFLEQESPLEPGMKVMEIGCGEGGVLKPFVERGLKCLGVDLAASRIANAVAFQAEAVKTGKLSFKVQDVYEDSFRENYRGNFDWVLLKDTIEHIPEQEKFIPYIKQFLKPGGKIFFGFPPWYMPFGGHQQICQSNFLGRLPYFHLLPKAWYRGILRSAGEAEPTIRELLEIKSTGISLERFEKIVHHSGLEIRQKTLYLFNPIYHYKFGLKVRKQSPIIAAIPVLRNFLTTAGWYLVGLQK